MILQFQYFLVFLFVLFKKRRILLMTPTIMYSHQPSNWCFYNYFFCNKTIANLNLLRFFQIDLPERCALANGSFLMYLSISYKIRILYLLIYLIIRILFISISSSYISKIPKILGVDFGLVNVIKYDLVAQFFLKLLRVITVPCRWIILIFFVVVSAIG